MSTFEERVDEIIARIGRGRIKGQVKVDQVYAHYQHEGASFKHPRGGKAYYLRDPLYQKHGEYLQAIATGLLHGRRMVDLMAEQMEKLSMEVYENAPREWEDLRASGNPIVKDDGVTVYDRPPMVRRLTEEELRIKGHLSDLFRKDLG